MVHIREFLINKYSKLPLKNTTNDTYYSFAKLHLKHFVKSISDIDDDSLKEIKEDCNIPNLLGNPSKLRFTNLLNRIVDDFLKVLALCYKGNFADASKLLNKILYTQIYGIYLNEHYVEYLSFNFERDMNTLYYRMRDIKSTDNSPDNCWHVPYNSRQYAYTGRFSLLGFPCLYIANCKETCNAELGNLQKGYRRWVASFRMKKMFSLYDLRIPNRENIELATPYNLFSKLINYPLIFLCSTQSINQGYNEEYYIPQLLLHLLFGPQKGEHSYKGIVYSSVKNLDNGYNIVLPALYNEKEPPSKGYSPILLELFEQQEPEIYKIKE